MDKPRVVAIGGGSGLAVLLRGLKNYPLKLSAIVTMTDNGASSGRLSRDLGVLPPGDIRQCLAALSNDEQLITKLFEYRFKSGRGLNGHSLGNLLLIALSDITGNFDAAIQASSKILAIKGEVIPSTFEHVSLISKLKNGQLALGEVDTAIQGHRHGIDEVFIEPRNAKANPRALNLISEADVIIFGPGSLYTSVIPNLLINSIKKEIEKSSALKIYVCNVSTERGETEGFGVEEHVLEIKNYLGETNLDYVIVNKAIIESTGREGKLGTISNISTTRNEIVGAKVLKCDVIDPERPLFHDPEKLSKVISELIPGALLASLNDTGTRIVAKAESKRASGN